MISSRASRTATSNTDVAFVMTEGGHVRRAKLNFGRERQDLRRVDCNWESSRFPNLPRAFWIFTTLPSTEDSQKPQAGAGDRDIVRKEVTAEIIPWGNVKERLVMI